MSKLRLWLEDLKSGKDTQDHVNLVLATIVAILALFGIIDQAIVAAVTLGVIALLAFSNLKAHRELRTLSMALSKLKQEGDASEFLMQRKVIPEIPNWIQNAKHIDLSMLAGHFVRYGFEPWEERLKEGAQIRLLFANPCDDEHICTLTSRGDTITAGQTADLQKDIVMAVRKLLSIIKKDYPGKLEFRFQRIVAPFGIFAVDPDGSQGVIKVEIYTHLTSIYHRPHFILKKNRDGQWYELFRSQFEQQWQIAADINSIGWEELTSI